MMFDMEPANLIKLVLFAGLCLLCLPAGARSDDRGAMLERVRRETLHAYKGPVVRGVDTKTLHGKVLCGYQGWFTADGDGSGRGWFHWAKNSRSKPSAGNIRVDLWPDLSEFGPDERFATDIKYADGRAAEVFSSFKKATVLRHFRWMREAGIDGVLVQRFATQVLKPAGLRQVNVVLAHCREGANRSGRTYAVEYDLSGLRSGQIDGVIADWRDLRRQMDLGDDPAYLHHEGRPVVEVWGIGFNDGRRRYSLEECSKLVKFLRDDGCHVICGVPTGWRTLSRDAVRDRTLLDVLRLGHVVSPWTVGRYRSPSEVVRHSDQCWKPDMEWCKRNGLEYMPVIFPGFSWHNQHDGPLNQIPRLKGRFLWKQFCEVHRLKATMVNVAMFDEVDEGTAIFKCTNDVPSGDGVKLLTFEGLPSDYYLKLVGLGTRLLRGQAKETDGPDDNLPGSKTLRRTPQ